MLRTVMTPSKGAFTCLYACISREPREIRLGRRHGAFGGRDSFFQGRQLGLLRLIRRLILIVLLARDDAAPARFP